MPPPIGSVLSISMSAPKVVPVAACNARAARTTRSLSAGTPGTLVTRATMPSSRRRKCSVSHQSTSWNTVCSVW
ncbi:hypothetical protein FQZ97_509440 [compost metagenome]